jgi:hypothetical protein
MALRSVRFGVWSRKLSHVGQSLYGWPKIYYFELLSASEGTLSRWSWLRLQSLAPTNPNWARVWPVLLCVIHNEGLCPSSGDINRLMMTMKFDLSSMTVLAFSRDSMNFIVNCQVEWKCTFWLHRRHSGRVRVDGFTPINIIPLAKPIYFKYLWNISWFPICNSVQVWQLYV